MIQVRGHAGTPWAIVAVAVSLLTTPTLAEAVDPLETEEIFEKEIEKEKIEPNEIPEKQDPGKQESDERKNEDREQEGREQEEKERKDESIAGAKDESVPLPKRKSVSSEKEKIVLPQMEEYAEFSDPGMIPEEEVVATACPTARCPSWNDYAVFDVLFLQRDDATNNQPFVIANDNSPNPGEFLMTTRSMTPSVAPGVRLVYGRRTSDCTGWEAGYLGVYGMYGDALAAGTNRLQVAGDLGENVPGFANATFAEADYWSSLNSAELNLFRSNSCESCDPCARLACKRCYHCTSVDWLAGFRWASLEEQATLGVIGRAGDRPTPYTVNTSSNLVGLQVGVRGRTEWQRVAFEGGIKTAVAGATLYQSQSDIASPINGFVARTARSSSTGGVGMIADINLAAIYRINRVWGLRAGYNLIWLSGVALAPSQFDFSFDGDSGLGLDHGAGLFLNGANLGLEARW